MKETIFKSSCYYFIFYVASYTLNVLKWINLYLRTPKMTEILICKLLEDSSWFLKIDFFEFISFLDYSVFIQAKFFKE